MYGNRIGASEWHPEVSVIGAVDRSMSGNVVLRIGRLWTDDPERGWQQTEHVVLQRLEATELVREIIEVVDPPESPDVKLVLRLKRDLARELLDRIAASPGNSASEEFASLWERLADFANPE
jgi:hypothetical protein